MKWLSSIIISVLMLPCIAYSASMVHNAADPIFRFYKPPVTQEEKVLYQRYRRGVLLAERKAAYARLRDAVTRGEITEAQAVDIVFMSETLYCQHYRVCEKY